MTFVVIVDGDPELAAPVMGNFRHVNYGSALLPVTSLGVGVNNTIDLGSSSNAFKKSFFSDDMAIATDVFFVDVSALGVGIGTTTPSAELEISKLGTTDEPSLKITSNAGSGFFFMGGSAATGTHAGISDADQFGLISSGAANFVISSNESIPIIFGTNDTQRMKVDGSTGDVTITNDLLVSTDLTVTGNTTATAGIDAGASGTFLKSKVIALAAINMDAVSSFFFTHGIADYKKIRHVEIIVRDDGDTTRSPITRVQSASSSVEGGVTNISSVIITWARAAGGVFDSASYSSTGFSRGDAIIWHEA